ncbi:hypothetical protein GCK72_014566 [Caenorhabditis remanei]|uniref:Uncharacterized protein n=1 Tax=Caenorhabditis remanei TaxID=31234 RepID=A0A6A5GRM5_CAERE|nr:hypothetical protein GCK72_014566 [Caenorhabditis remanei]KAF1758108.1 hypothetical protein GCK72_014566 [Caenorhabditis remanei]
MLNLSEWASVKLEAIGPEGREDFFVSKCSSFVDPLGCTTKFVNGEIVVEGTLTLKPVAKYYDLLYYKHGLLGLVQGNTDLYLGYENEDVHVQFTRLEPENYRKLTIHEYKAVNKKFDKTLDEWERVCWRARRLDRSSLDSSNRSREEDLSDCNKGKDFCNNSSSIPQDPLKTPEKMKYVESRNDCQTCEHPNHTPQRQNFYDNSYEESSDNGIPYQQSYQNFSQSSSQYYSPRPTDFNHLESERQYYNHSFVPSEMDTASVTTDSNNLISSIGMIVSRHKQMMVVYLDDFRRAGILRWKHFDSSFIKLGNLFRCVCKPIEIQEETLHASYEVIKIIELVNERNETIVKDEECQVLVNVNLFKQDPVFNDFTRKSGRFVLSSGDFGNVLMEDTVVNVTGQVVPSAGVIEEYRGLPGSDTMVGYCVYKKCLIPPMLIDSSCRETAEVVAYAWRLVKLVSTLTHYSFNQQDIKIKNLGEKASTLEKEDDISRQKKQAQIQFELDNQNRQGSSSVGFHQRPQSSSNYENFATPQGSVYNHRMESSQSYRTANEYRLGSQRASSPSLRSEITQPGYNANMTPTFRSTPQPMQHYDLQADNEKILRMLEVLNERVSVFTRNPDTREVMHSLAPGHLAMLEEAMESSEKVCILGH